MADSEQRRRGAEMMARVYAGDVKPPPPGQSAFVDLMLEQVFAEVWTREELSVRDRRLVLIGIIAALGEKDTFQIQVRSALKNGELTPAQVREALIMIANYAIFLDNSECFIWHNTHAEDCKSMRRGIPSPYNTEGKQ